MATYKVIQDIEAEDKFLGPLTLKQFIFAATSMLFGYLSFVAIAKNAAFLLAIFMPIVFLGAFLAFPWSREQSTEIWVLAKLRFYFKPKVRIWDQTGLEELVTVTAPKKIEKQLTNGLDQTEVKSRLKALAETIDTRGWATKNATLGTAYAMSIPSADERLIDPAAVPQQVPEVDTNSYTDVLDDNTAMAENFEHMIEESAAKVKQQSLEKMQRIRNGEPLETIQQPPVNFTPPSDSYAKKNDELDEKAWSERLRNNRQAGDLAQTHLRTLSVYPGAGSMAAPPASQPPVQQPAENPTPTSDIAAPQQAQAQMTSTPDPAILNLAQNNDLNISTIARQAQKSDGSEDEVVISLR